MKAEFPTGEKKPEIVDLESAAESELDQLLSMPENNFLTEVKANEALIENAPTAVDSLRIAKELIDRRLEKTFTFGFVGNIEGVELLSVDYKTVARVIDTIKGSSIPIGYGGDAVVVISKDEIAGLPEEICYKFAKEAEVKRGRNTMETEAIIHSEAYEEAKGLQGCSIGVPEPYYVSRIGASEMFAMERLHAESVDNIQRGMARLPDWFDVGEYVDGLKMLLDHLHEKGIFHRDMHLGNLMVRLSAEPPEDGKTGYLIDFGVSAKSAENLKPYERQVAGDTFTYNDDYAIIKEAQRVLNRVRALQNSVRKL